MYINDTYIVEYLPENFKAYIEPFVGGANVIDKIECVNKIGCDSHPYLISLLNYAKEYHENIPSLIAEEEYNDVKNNKDMYEDWYVGLVGFCATFGAKWFGGYARSKNDKFHGEKSHMAIKNLKKQCVNFGDITFECKDFRDIKNINGYD